MGSPGRTAPQHRRCHPTLDRDGIPGNVPGTPAPDDVGVTSTSIDRTVGDGASDPAAIDPAGVEAFAQLVAADLAAAMSAPLVWIGDKLGLYEAMTDGRPVTAAALAGRVGTDVRMTLEWLRNQAAGGYVCVERGHDDEPTFRLPPEHAAVLVDGGSLGLQGWFDCVTGLHRSVDQGLTALRTGTGLAWHDHHPDFFDAVDRLLRPTRETALVEEWFPALGGAVDRLGRGGRVADVGCGRGASAVLVAKRFPHVSVHGFDVHGPSIEAARDAARAAGVAERCTFTEVPADDVPAGNYDVLLLVDCLHHMGDPGAVARRARKVVAPDGVVMVVEPIAGDRLEDNLHPVGRLLYAASTLVCTPSALADGGTALGAQAGPAAVSSLLLDAGFAEVATVATSPFHYVLAARPPG